ncbi:MAG TPA: thiamine pyrophosphate-binding protein [Reyranella sp.]|nr:thiamine pyrophosphate-binding protein [Reyranella sp.]
MKELIKQYLDQGISRRQLVSRLSALGLSTVAAKAVAQSLGSVVTPAQAATSEGAMREITGTGGHLFVQQLKAAGVEFIFFNPSTGDAPIFDATVDEPGIQLIKGIQEGVVAGMADGYARLSGKTGIVIVANVGLPNAMTQMVNTFKDRIPMLTVVAAFGQDKLGAEGPQDYDYQEYMMGPITKWRWMAQSAAGIPETTRRALKFAATPPSGPVFLAIPDNELRAQATATVMDQSLFDVAMKVRPDKADIEKAAKLLIEAKNPLLTVGDEITLCRGEKEAVVLAELLGLPVAGQAEFGVWSKPFPTRNPLYLGPMLRHMRFPGEVDVHLNVGDRYAELAQKGTTLISMRQDATSLARAEPVDLPMVADVRLGMADLIDAIKSMATADRLKKIAEDRASRVHAYTKQQAEMLKTIAAKADNGPEIRRERLAIELENGLEKDTIYVTDCDSGRAMDPLMSFGGSDKAYISTGPNILGWAVSAAFGAKLARPNQPVVAILGDGSMSFGGPRPLWSHARYKAPITTIVYNNRSYNNERNRIWSFSGGAQFKEGRDMTCYNGSPDIDFAKAAAAFGVEGEVVKEASQIKEALARAKRANVEGRPYLLDINVMRDGVGAATAWHPEYSIADKRTRKV